MMGSFGEFLSNLRTGARLSLEDLALLADGSKSTLSRLENDEVSRPFRGAIRKLIINLAEILCASPKDSERYLELAGLKHTLTEVEEVQLGFTPAIPPGVPTEEHNFVRLQLIYEQRLADLERRAVLVRRLPASLQIKQQYYTNTLNEIKEELERLQNKKKLSGAKTMQVSPAHLITESLVLLNFAHHPLTGAQKASIEELTGRPLDKTLDIPTLIVEDEPLEPQIADLLATIDLSVEEWHASHILVNPPGYAPAAFLLLAEFR